MVRRLVSAPYNCTRLNPCTFLIVHDDKQHEHPFFYAIVHPLAHIIVMIDTGSGSVNPPNDDVCFKDIIEFLEMFPVADNGGLPLNPSVGADGKACEMRRYLVINTHVHFDHIGGNGSFARVSGTKFVASGLDKAFLKDGPARRKHSQCDEVGMELPKYHIDKYASDGEQLHWPLEGGEGSIDLRLKVLWTPGHTPDSLAIYDYFGRSLYTGDTFYYRRCTLPGGIPFRQPIIFNDDSNFADFQETLNKLRTFARLDARHRYLQLQSMYDSGRYPHPPQMEEVCNLKIHCAHTTAGAPALTILKSVERYARKMVNRKLPKVARKVGGQDLWLWQEPGDPEFSVLGPQWLLDDVQAKRRCDGGKVEEVN